MTYNERPKYVNGDIKPYTHSLTHAACHYYNKPSLLRSISKTD